jgi:CRP/FNR family cyclic AMP-dependent transcriptional regulator
MTKLDSVRGSSLFKGLSAEDFEILDGLFKEKQVKEGATIFVENMAGESLYLIKQGTVSISKMMGEGKEKILVVLGAEEIFGEMALLEGGPRMANARAAEQGYFLSLGRADFEKLCLVHPNLGLKLLRNILRVFTRRLRENDKHYRDMLAWVLNRTP